MYVFYIVGVSLISGIIRFSLYYINSLTFPRYIFSKKNFVLLRSVFKSYSNYLDVILGNN